MLSTLFKPVPEEKSNPDFDAHIAGIQSCIDVFEKTLTHKEHRLLAPEIHVPIGIDHTGIIRRASITDISTGLSAHKNRLATLNKMKKNESITETELTLLIQVAELKNDPKITGYEKVIRECHEKTIRLNK